MLWDTRFEKHWSKGNLIMLSQQEWWLMGLGQQHPRRQEPVTQCPVVCHSPDRGCPALRHPCLCGA